MRLLLWGMIALVALTATGCRKKSAPEYYRLESQVEVLSTRDGDDGWMSAEMEAVLQRLGGISPDAVEGPAAAALASRITGERTRIAAERAAAEADRLRPSAPAPSLDLGRRPEPVAGTPDEVDAGPLVPRGGMSLQEFLKAFGDCMDQVPPEDVAGLGKASAYSVRATTGCQDRFKVPNERSRRLFFFVDDRLVAERTEDRTPAPVVDAGRQAPSAPAAAPQPQMWMPGMPQPGYEAPDAQ
jgi:hypothetical protein